MDLALSWFGAMPQRISADMNKMEPIVAKDYNR
jgi:hypothetical protein